METWARLAEIEFRLRTAARPEGALRGDGWFAALSGQDHGELNVCGISPVGTTTTAVDLAAAIGDLPAVVFTSQHVAADVRDVLIGVGFEAAMTPEPLMHVASCPLPVAGPFRAAPATTAEVGYALRLTSEAHHVDERMLTASIGVAAAAGAAEPWLAWDNSEPVSVVWLVPCGDTLGVTEMMTPARHQRRGAGRALLTAALAARWTPKTDGALLLSTAAGRRLYESIGFRSVDEVVTLYRGLTPDVLEAIGQPTL